MCPPPSAEPGVVVALRVPIPVEVVPELGMLTNLGAEGVSDLLRRDRDRFVARKVVRNIDGPASVRLEPAWADALDTAGKQGGSAHVRHEQGRPEQPRASSKHR